MGEECMNKMFPNNKKMLSNKSYDEIAKPVNDELKQSKNEIFDVLKETDDKLNLPWGTSFQMSGYADYFESIYEDDDD
jgi:hypothetical protein